MDALKKTGGAIEKVLAFITDIAFFTIFVTFMLTIVSRYVFKKPVTWSYEVSVLGYIWTMFFGVGLGMKRDEHVVFGLVFDNLDGKGKFSFTMIYNVLLLFLLLVSTLPCLKALSTRRMVTGVLKLPFKIVFAPFILMYVDMMVRTVQNIIGAKKKYLEGSKEANV